MSDQASSPSGPDLAVGIPTDSLQEGVPLLAHVEGAPVILLRRGADVFAIGATCTHYGGPLAEGLVVDRHLETSAKGIFAIGDVARWPDPRGGGNVRIEHWVLAQRHGQAVARTIAGERAAFGDVPFFWSQHYDLAINYVGHAAQWDGIEIDGSLERRDCTVRYRRGGRVLAVATISRDRESMEAELAMERELARP